MRTLVVGITEFRMWAMKALLPIRRGNSGRVVTVSIGIEQ